MNQTSNGGAHPPSEPERSLNEMLDDDLCEAIDQVEAFDLGPGTDPRTDRRRSLGSRLNQAHQMIVAAIATADRKLRASLS
jgi:hypothetical protein